MILGVGYDLISEHFREIVIPNLLCAAANNQEQGMVLRELGNMLFPARTEAQKGEVENGGIVFCF